MALHCTTPNVAGLVLASGLSRRFGPKNKLLADLDGRPVIYHTVAAYTHSEFDGVWVVIGHNASQIMTALDDLDTIFVHNPDFGIGQSRALHRGVRAIPAHVDAVVIGVGDQPFITPAILRTLAAGHVETNAPIVVPRYAGQRGNPVLFHRRLFPELLDIDGDRGGRSVIERHVAQVHWLDFPDEHAPLDIDTTEDLRRAATAKVQTVGDEP
ncbi:MAG: hypothetical protein NVS9B15_14030 [Acidobacteriaceae bacterium]